MLDIKFIEDNFELVVKKMTDRNTRIDFDLLGKLIDDRKNAIKEAEQVEPD